MAWVRAWRLELAPTMEAALATWIAGHLQAFAPPADTPVIARISPSATRPAADQAFAHLEMMDVPMRAWRLARPRGVDASLPGASSRKPGIDVDPADMALLVESNQGWAAWQIDGAGIATAETVREIHAPGGEASGGFGHQGLTSRASA